jgi:hypothetical protein
LNVREQAAGKPPKFTDSALKELEYAGLLHDFGKVYIDPSIFLKAKKLFPSDFDKLKLRLKYLRRSMELDFALRRSDLDEEALGRLDRERDLTIQEFMDISKTIEGLNEPAITSEDPQAAIERILSIPLPLVRGIENEPIPLLTEDETVNLSIRRGSLNNAERAEIERHVVRSYEFVRRIPWPREFEGIPGYIKSHHEMLDGSGYPDHLSGGAIPLQGRILAVVDIYDALTASDRPYKKAVPPEKAMAILEEEAKRGKLDPDLVALMREIV